jgi:hypothetical protein
LNFMTRMSFEEALRVLGVRRTSGPAAAQAAYEQLVLRCGPGVPREVREQLDEAWALVKSPTAWPTSAFDEVLAEHDDPAPSAARQSERKRPVTDFLRARLDARARIAQASLGAKSPTPASAPPLPPSRDPRVLDLVEAVDAGSDVLDAEELLVTLDRGQVDGVMTSLRMLLNAGEMDSLGRLAAGLLDCMGERPEWEWFEPKTLLRLTLRLHSTARTNPDALGAAVEIQKALDRYKHAPGNRRVAYDIQTSARWRWSSELAALGPEFPPEARALIAEATASGGAHEAKADLDLWLRKNRAAGLAVAAKLRLACPSLSELYADILPVGDGAAPSPAAAPTRPTAPAGEASSRSAPTRPSRAAPAFAARLRWLTEVPRWAWVAAVIAVAAGIYLPRWIHAAQAEHPLAADLAFAREQLCEAFGAGTPGCTWAGVVTGGIARGECEVVSKSLPRLAAELETFELSAGVRQRASAAAATGDSPRGVVGRLSALQSASCPEP